MVGITERRGQQEQTESMALAVTAFLKCTANWEEKCKFGWRVWGMLEMTIHIAYSHRRKKRQNYF